MGGLAQPLYINTLSLISATNSEGGYQQGHHVQKSPADNHGVTPMGKFDGACIGRVISDAAL